MSNAQSQARQQAIDYMVRLLQMNPIQEGDEIVRARGKALGLVKKAESKSAAPAEEQKADRRKLLDQLEAVRAQFWTMPIEKLNDQLRALAGQGFQDVKAAVTRLRVVAAHRALFPPLAGKPGFDGDFFSSLKEVLVRSPRDTAVLREQVLSTFRNRARRKSGRRMVELLRTEMPDIYELEADWFNTLYRQKAQLPAIRLTSSSSGSGATAVGSSSNARNYWWVVVVIIGAIRGLIAVSDEHSTKSSSHPTYSTPNIQMPAHPSYSPPSRDLNQPRQTPGQRPSGIPHVDSGTWKTYRSAPPPRTVQPNTRPPSEFDGRFGTPHTIEPSAPSKRPDERFPR